MRVNAVAALTGAVYHPGSAAPTVQEESGDFAVALESQLALLPLLAGSARAEDGPPIEVTQAEMAAPDDSDTDDAPAAPAIITPAVTLTPLNDAALAAASLAAAAGPDNAASPAVAETRAASAMLRMIASPQAQGAASLSSPVATPPQAQDAPLFVFTPPKAQNASGDESLPSAAPAPTSTDSRPPAGLSDIAPAPMAAQASMLTSAATAPTRSAPPPPAMAHAALEPEVGSPAWQQALGHQLSSFTRHGVHHAELRLHPEELGPLQISLRLSQDQAQLHFVTDHHQVRAALEAAMPHLRSALAGAGIQLDQGSVGGEAPSWGASADSGAGQASPQSEEGEDAAPHAGTEAPPAPRLVSGRPGISIFA